MQTFKSGFHIAKQVKYVRIRNLMKTRNSWLFNFLNES